MKGLEKKDECMQCKPIYFLLFRSLYSTSLSSSLSHNNIDLVYKKKEMMYFLSKFSNNTLSLTLWPWRVTSI